MAFRGWEKLPIRIESGETVEAIAPVIVSASRATDIPAFHAEWFMARLRAGYAPWRNPFNAWQTQYVSFRKTRAVVFWSKNPAPLLPHLPAIDALGINYYFQFTLNDYDADALEPGVPPLVARVETFRRLADRIGPERVVWRFDPLVLTERLTAEALLRRIERLAEALRGCTRKLVISFADIERYRAVQRRLSRHSAGAREFTPEEMASFAVRLVERNERWGFELASCAEEMALDGIAPNRCIDDRLLARCFGDDAELMDFLGVDPLFPGEASSRAALKDRGQRRACGCIVSKDIGEYGTCGHGCLYCYAQR
ncbi:DUF1848 domain-containing protein [Chlorobaculum thiosulfatiphilum]|uniref:DUF1848 domain-containing protein n=1 Tax=Chlorobaculum thiosulfatiphilum TaxID=115852 RepID=A0A5C4S7P1_CHLTI|nr:DUF1848 domain-containing protein [Chlorobaculum thiosulfatiphilum]TNJ39325.1 DUF1848 domain-containing protein [Chlorobaculum thiosulfatiphilum]